MPSKFANILHFAGVTNLMAQFEKTKTVALTPENKKALQDILQVQIESQEDCAVCLETLHNPVRD